LAFGFPQIERADLDWLWPHGLEQVLRPKRNGKSRRPYRF